MRRKNLMTERLSTSLGLSFPVKNSPHTRIRKHGNGEREREGEREGERERDRERERERK
jgi:hypothetical protein